MAGSAMPEKKSEFYYSRGKELTGYNFVLFHKIFHSIITMAYNEKLADRVREIIASKENNIEEKKMFGGLCFMVNDKMCVGVQQHNLMLRIAPEKFEEALEKEGCRPMEFGGRTMTGFVYVDESALNTKKKLETWLQMPLEYNKFAKASKKKKSPASEKK